MEVAMATLETTLRPHANLSVRRLAATGAIGTALIFVLCWIGTFIPFTGPTHAFIGLFTQANMQSGTALVEGSLWSFLFGGLSGALIAAIYNMLGGLEGR